LTCLIVRNKLNEARYKNDKLGKADFLQLSLKNTIIKNAKQYYLTDYSRALNLPYRLGIKYTSENGKWIDNEHIFKDSIYNNEMILQNLLNDLKLIEFGSRCQYKTNLESGFSYDKYHLLILE
jgi:hypothetical protein